MEGVRDRPVCRLLRVLVVGTGGVVQQRSGIVWIEASAVLIASAQGQLPGSRRRRRRPLCTRRPGMVKTFRRSVAAVARCRSGPARMATARPRLCAMTVRASQAALA